MKRIIVFILCLFTLSSCNIEKPLDIKYEITFDNLGHGSVVDKVIDVNNIPNELPILFEDGFEFIGWYLDSECSEKAIENSSINSDVTLYAKWNKLEFTPGLEYVLSSDGLSYIVYAYNVDVKNIVIPNEYEGLPVKYIGEGAFMGDEVIESVMIPSTIEKIDRYAFSNCKNLKYVSVGKSVNEINYYAFCNVPSLEKIVVDFNNLTLDSRNNCNAIIETSTNMLVVGCKNTVIPDSVSKIDKYAFYGCSELIEITIPIGVTHIGECAFHSCKSLKTVVVLEGLESINDFAFTGCESLKNIYNQSNLVFTNDDMMYGGIGANATNIYNKNEWSYVGGVPTPNS